MDPERSYEGRSPQIIVAHPETYDERGEIITEHLPAHPLSPQSPAQISSHQPRALNARLYSAQRSNLAGLGMMMESATSITVSRSTVVYDGQRTYVDAEEQRYAHGRWTRDHVEGVWEGDRARDVIQGLSARAKRPIK